MKESKTLDQKIELAKNDLKSFDEKKKEQRQKLSEKLQKLENKKRESILKQFDGMSIDDINKAIKIAKEQK